MQRSTQHSTLSDRPIVRGLSVGFLCSFFTTISLPSDHLSNTGTVIAGAIVWCELISVTILVTLATSRPSLFQSNRLARALLRFLPSAIIAIPTVGWLIILPFAHDYLVDLVLFVVALVIVMIMISARAHTAATKG
jgi:hypothetical protein